MMVIYIEDHFVNKFCQVPQFYSVATTNTINKSNLDKIKNKKKVPFDLYAMVIPLNEIRSEIQAGTWKTSHV